MEDYMKEKIITEYCENDMKKLKRICNPLIIRKGFGLDRIECDDLYSIAMETLWKCVDSFDETKDCSFNTYLTGIINKRFFDWTRDSRRGIRCNLERDTNGRIKKDERKQSIPIPNESLDVTTDDGVDFAEKISSGFTLEEMVFNVTDISLERNSDMFSEKVQCYLKRLSKLQKEILTLMMRGYNQEEIKEELHMTSKQYSANVAAIRAYENVRVLM